MILLGIKIGFIAFIAAVTFGILAIALLSVIGAFSRDYEARKKSRSDKVTPMPRKES